MKRTAAVAAILVFWLAGSAQATPLTVSLWTLVPEPLAQNAIPANVPLTPPNVTFDVNSPLNFNPLQVGPQTVLEWLLSGGAFNINGSASALSARMEVPGVSGTIVEFLGLVDIVTGQSVAVTHDDGLTLIIGGTNLGFDPGPSGPTTTTMIYTGPSGLVPFQLVYADCCGSPAVLAWNQQLQPQPVPEPATLTLVGTGFVLGSLRRRFQRRR